MNDFDVVVVGGSFAGLNFARHASASGLNVLVLEKDRVGEHIRTTGILIRRLVDEMKVPKECMANRVNKIFLFSPDGRRVTLSRRTNRFFMSRTDRFLKWLAETAKKSGAVIRENCLYTRSEKSRERLTVKYRSRGKTFSVKADYIVGCDGALSGVAREFGMSRNTRLLFGLENIYENLPVDDSAFYCFLDYEIAPGYMAWAAPVDNQTLAGLAGYHRGFSPEKSMRMFEKRLSRILDFSKSKIVGKRGGLMPINSVLKNIVNERCLLLGDSAGMIEALTAGGIYPSISFSRTFGGLVADYLKNHDNKLLDGKNYRDSLHKRMKHGLMMRRLYDSLDSNKNLNKAFGLLEKDAGKKIFGTLFLGAGKMQNLPKRDIIRLAKHPSIYPLIGKAALRFLS